MVHFWRVRLGEVVINGKGNYEYLFDLCKKEEPPCIAVGWGKIDLSKNINDIKRDHDQKYPGEKIDLINIKSWIAMEEGDMVIVMKRPAIICAIGEIIRERYRKEFEGFKLKVVGGRGHSAKNPYGEVCFFNRIDVSWITNPDKYIKVSSLALPNHTENLLHQQRTIINITANDFNLIHEGIESYVPIESESPPKYNRSYDNYVKSGR
jgi:hypothetical protein